MTKNKSSDSLPNFETPPVSEVVFGVQFEVVKEFKSPHLGVLWGKLSRDRYPDYQEVNFLPHIIEMDQNTVQTMPLIEGNAFPLPRVFFINPTGHELVQVQQDRFLRNWRKNSPEDSYPRYEVLFPKFEESLEKFEQFISEEFDGTKLNIDQYELTYVNHININESNLSAKQLSKYFSFYADDIPQTFLPNPVGIGWNAIYELPDEQGKLRVSLSPVNNSTGKGQFVLNLTARGINKQKDLKSWFEVAHEWIVRGFTDITCKQAQQENWGIK